MKLYEIISSIENCVKVDENISVNTDTGEIVDVDALNALEMERDTKIENIGLWIKNLNADVEALKAEKNAFALREKQAKAKVEQLKQYLTACLDGKGFKSDKLVLSFRKSEAVEIIGSLDNIPEELLTIKAPEANKAAIKKALKDGAVIAGCQLVERNNIQIR